MTKMAHVISLAVTFQAWCIPPTHADVVYRCGEAYSASPQCANGTATEVKPNAMLYITGPDNANAAMRDLRDAQALEKQRLQTEQQGTQAAPIRLSTTSAPSANPPPSQVSQTEPIAQKGKHKAKYAHKANSPYFTAVDPTATSKKKSTAKAVPASSHP